MGAIYVNMKLTNAVDESLAYDGAIQQDKVRGRVIRALVDTGAIRSVVPLELVETLGVKIRSESEAQDADGRKETVGVTGPILFEVEGRETLEEALVLGDEVLIGQTVLEKLDLMADCTNQRLVPIHPEGPISIVK